MEVGDRYSFLTPQPRRSAKPEDILLTTRKIEKTSKKINKISSETADLRTKCLRMDGDLYALTDSIEKAIKKYEDINHELEIENEKMYSDLNQKYAVLTEMGEKLEILLSLGVGLSTITCLQLNLIKKYFDTPEELLNKEAFPPMIQEIIANNEFFSSCDTLKSFIRRCIELRDMSKEYNTKRDSYVFDKKRFRRISELGEQLNALQIESNTMQSTFTSEIGDLYQTKCSLGNKLQSLKSYRGKRASIN